MDTRSADMLRTDALIDTVNFAVIDVRMMDTLQLVMDAKLLCSLNASLGSENTKLVLVGHDSSSWEKFV